MESWAGRHEVGLILVISPCTDVRADLSDRFRSYPCSHKHVLVNGIVKLQIIMRRYCPVEGELLLCNSPQLAREFNWRGFALSHV